MPDQKITSEMSLDFSPDMFCVQENVEIGETDLPIDTKQNGRIFVPTTYEIIDGYATLEGDIILGEKDDLSFKSKGIGRTGNQFRWKSETIPFIVDLPIRERVISAISHWGEHTPFFFNELESPPRSKRVDYIHFRAHATANNSYVGRQGKEQVINIKENGGTVGNVVHEIGHAIGLWHEQSRHDRDDHITILWENVKDGENNYNFRKMIDHGFDIGKYDFRSIMHYSAKAFSINGKDTIVTKNHEKIGQRDGLSSDDINAVKTLYPNLDWTITGATRKRRNMSAQTTEVDLAALEKEWTSKQNIAKAQLEVLKTEQSIKAASIPSGTTKAMEGKITTETGSGYLAEIAAYKAMQKITGEIAKEINNLDLGKNPIILLTDSLDILQGSIVLSQLELQVESWKNELQSFLRPLEAASKGLAAVPLAADALSATMVIPGLLSFAADIAAYFQVNYDIKTRKVEKSDIAIRLEISRNIQNAKVQLPSFYFLEQGSYPPILVKIQELLDLRKNLGEKFALSQKQNTGNSNNSSSELITSLKLTLDAFDAFFKAINTPGTDTPSSLAQAAIHSELLNRQITHLLYLTVTSVGADVIAGQGLFQAGKIAYLGGGIISYVLSTTDGTILTAGSPGDATYLHCNLRKSKDWVLPKIN